MKVRNKKELKPLRAILRKNMPAPELVLWQKIRGNSLGAKFRRQFSVENHILDFYAPTVRLGIEIDGESHFENPETVLKDKVRDFKLAKQGIKVLRFTNREVMDNLEGVLTEIQENLPPLNLPLSRFARQGEKSIHV